MVGHNIVWSLISQADFLSKLTLFVLLCMSIICWMVAVIKFLTIRITTKQLSEGLKKIQNIYTFDELMREVHHLNSYVSLFLGRANFKLKHLLHPTSDGTYILHTKDKELLELALDELMQQEIAYEERYLSFLSTSAEVAPLIGLFGTVWGIIHAFIRISEAQTSDIAVVAPGIAEALITTLAGLVVAIPALIMYHYLCRRIEGFVLNLRMVAHHFEVVVQKTFLSEMSR